MGALRLSEPRVSRVLEFRREQIDEAALRVNPSVREAEFVRRAPQGHQLFKRFVRNLVNLSGPCDFNLFSFRVWHVDALQRAAKVPKDCDFFVRARVLLYQPEEATERSLGLSLVRQGHERLVRNVPLGEYVQGQPVDPKVQSDLTVVSHFGLTECDHLILKLFIVHGALNPLS